MVLTAYRKEEEALAELKSQKQLGWSIRALGTVGFGGLLLFTQAPIFGVLVLFSWLMAYTLIDRRALRAYEREPEDRNPKDAAVGACPPRGPDEVLSSRQIHHDWAKMRVLVSRKGSAVRSAGVTVKEFQNGRRGIAPGATLACVFCGGRGHFAGTFEGLPVCRQCTGRTCRRCDACRIKDLTTEQKI